MKTFRIACIAALAAAACNDVPIDGLTDSFRIRVTQNQENSKPVKVDFLWVIDDSASMCQEQAQLAASAQEFLNRIQSFVNMDFRLAVVTTDVLSPDKMGRFQYSKTTEYPFACAESRIIQCLPGDQGNSLCTGSFGDGWRCDGPDKPKQVVNCNGTFNSKCKRNCTLDADCDGDPNLGGSAEQAEKCKANPDDCLYKCLKPSGDPTNTGCVLRPSTKQCPETDQLYTMMTQSACQLPDGNGGTREVHVPYLTNENAQQLFKCVAVVGAQQHNNSNLESGLGAALLALDKNGINADQAQCFLRDDAYLVIVFMSDEEDCTTRDCNPGESCAPNGWYELKKEQYGTCGCLPTADQPDGKLRSVTDIVNRIKSLKNDPGKILVASITGDSVKTDPAEREADRQSYFASKCSKCEDTTMQHPLLFNTYICDSAGGKADYGSRYVQFVERFGKNGILTNLCSEEGVGPALDVIADRIIRVVTKLCLPRPIADPASLGVTLIGPAGKCGDGSACTTNGDPCADGSQCVGDEAPAGFDIVPSPDCDVTHQAIEFHDILPAGAGVQIDYQADPFPQATTGAP